MCKKGNSGWGSPTYWTGLGRLEKLQKPPTNFMEVAKQASFLRWLDSLNALESVSYETADPSQTGTQI